MPAHTWTLVGCLALYRDRKQIDNDSTCWVLAYVYSVHVHVHNARAARHDEVGTTYLYSVCTCSIRLLAGIVHVHMHISIPGLVLGRLATFATTEAAMRLQLYRALVTPDDVVKSKVLVRQCPLQPLLFIGVANELAVRAASKRPAKSASTAQDRSQGDVATARLQ